MILPRKIGAGNWAIAAVSATLVIIIVLAYFVS